MKAAIIKAIIQLLADEKTRKRVIVLLLSLITGLLGMMIMPIIVLQTLGKMQPPEIAIDESALLSGISTEQTAAMEADGQAIVDALAARGLQRQIIKAQLVYMSCFEEGQISNFDEYANIFSIGDDSILIACLNSTYGIEIEYEDFDSTGTGFYSTWFGRNNDLNDSQFKKDIDLVINMLRKDLLQSRNAMRQYLCEHEGLPFPFDSCEGKGFKVETEANVFYLRCLPMQGNYDCYCYGYNKELLEQALAPDPEQEDTMEMGGMNQ